MATRTSLTPMDWTIAAMSALAEGGVEAISVERLARQMGTSKGSFYWHFPDRPALLAAVLEMWEREGTIDLIGQVAHLGDTPERIRALAREAVLATSRGIDVARTEAAIRAWAAQDGAVGARFVKVEHQRIAYLSAELAALGYDAATALRLSKTLYLTLIGLYAARGYAPDLADDEAFLDLVERIIAGAPSSP